MDSRWPNSIGQEQRALTLYCPQSKLLCNVTCFLFLLWLQVTIILLLIITTYVVLYAIDDDNSVTLDIGRSNKMTCFPGPEEFNKDRSSRVFLETLLWKGPGTAHWVICQWKSSPNPRMSIPSTEQLNGHEKPPNRSQTYAPKGAVMTENWHLSCASTKIKFWLLQLLTFNTPWKEFWLGIRLRHSVIWNPDRAGQDIDNS